MNTSRYFFTKFRILISVLFATSTFFSCSNDEELPREPTIEEKVERELSQMDLKAKVCQMFVVRPESLTVADMEQGKVMLTDEMVSTFKEYPVGGICLFAHNITTPDQLRSFTNALHSLNPRPLLYVDEEGGRVARIANTDGFGLQRFESMTALAENGNPKDVYNASYYIGTYVKDYGFDVDLAPVSDVNTNPENIVIGRRAFSSDPYVARSMVLGYIDGLWAAGIKGCLKHFPGHGDVKGDTHTGYVATQKSWDEMLNCEMITFKGGIAHGVQMIMTAHIATPTITGNDLPATMSHVILTEKLRGELGFKGIIITDAMEMGAIIQHYNASEAAIGTIKAGVDIVLLPQSVKEAIDAVIRAVETKEISEERINESVRRILSFKLRR